VDKDVALVEMGMNHAGELTDLSHIVEPDVVVCTMVGRAHMEFFGTIEKVADAKEEIYLSAPKNARLVFNIDNPQTVKMFERAQRGRAATSLFTFSQKDSKATVQLKIKKATLDTLILEGVIDGVDGEAEVAVFGIQNLTNIMAAATIGIAVGMTADQVWAALPRCRTIWGRNQILETKSGAKVIFDAYNANPDSMKALIDNMQLVSIKGKKIGVFGQMREMGSLSPDLHKELGQWVGAAGFSDVFFIGSDHEAFLEGVQTSGFKGSLHIEPDFNEKIGAELTECLSNNDLVAMKASRGTKLERFVPYAGVIDFQSK
jgi:UDP-N-acetylmuramoyl-tripeptide--D-alanyl-D-alanine ligase